MAEFVSKSGVIDIKVGTSPSRNGTPILEVPNLIPGNVVKVTANFAARTNQTGRAHGFYYQISAINADEVKLLTPADTIFQGSDGWQSCGLTVLFKVEQVSQSPTEDVDFEVLFSQGDLDGSGQILNFILFGEVISTSEP